VATYELLCSLERKIPGDDWGTADKTLMQKKEGPEISNSAKILANAQKIV
jgi:hypothetical protein